MIFALGQYIHAALHFNSLPGISCILCLDRLAAVGVVLFISIPFRELAAFYGRRGFSTEANLVAISIPFRELAAFYGNFLIDKEREFWISIPFRELAAFYAASSRPTKSGPAYFNSLPGISCILCKYVQGRSGREAQISIPFRELAAFYVRR